MAIIGSGIRDGILRLRGKIIDKISAYGEELLPLKSEIENAKIKGTTDTATAEIWMAASQNTLKSWAFFTFSHFIDSHYKLTSKSLEDALWMTLIAGGL